MGLEPHKMSETKGSGKESDISALLITLDNARALYFAKAKRLAQESREILGHNWMR